ncbi:hypothetical protein LCGC14_0437700 [marine sediment metagenome]|uniref:Uncharacterized protein n=1 Tax=marine sediment metagenome TaxID=412755 RepID=A0A0F9SSQ2_9ZZZZ
MRKFMETTEVSETNETEHEQQPLKEVDAAVDNPVLVNTVQERLDNLNRLTKEETTVSDEEVDDSTSEVKDGSDAQESDQTESQTESTESTSEAEVKEDGSIKIPDAYMRAAVHHGLNKEDVGDMVKANPESAMKLLESCYLSVNNASREWSELGRAKIEVERAKTIEQTVTEVVEQVDPTMAAKVAKLRKEYPDDPLIEVIITDLEKKPKPVQQVQPVPQARQNYETATARANVAGNLAIDQRVNAFFGADTMTPYDKFYGKLELGQIPEDLTNGQQLNRITVLQEAEFIMAGHNSRGQKIEVEQALEKAHFIVTEPIRKQVIRDGIKATATKRKNSMTLRPSESRRTGDSLNTGSSKPRNRSELELSVQQNLDRVFKN